MTHTDRALEMNCNICNTPYQLRGFELEEPVRMHGHDLVACPRCTQRSVINPLHEICRLCGEPIAVDTQGVATVRPARQWAGGYAHVDCHSRSAASLAK